MPKRIYIKDGGLTSSIPTPTGYTVIGSDNGTPKKQIESTISDIGLPYKIYTALLTQSGTNAPVATVLENTLGNVQWTRDGFGSYIATLTGGFPQNKTWFISGGTVNIPFGGNTNATAYLYWNDPNSIGLYANNGTGTLADNLLNYTSIEIRVYN